MQKLVKIFLIALPPALFFSYHPVLSIAENSTMNFELSIPEIWLILFFLISLPQIPALFRFYGLKKIFAAAIIPVYFTFSAFWSANPVRSILTAAIFALLVYAALHIIYQLKIDQTKTLRRAILRSLLISAVAVSLFCWLQCVLDLAGLSREQTLLCKGCVYTAFGFPHPNGFAIEPQFMGNLLLAPTLLAVYLAFAPTYKNHRHHKLFILLALFLSTTLFLTLSRGAIYAFIVALIVEQVLIFITTRKRQRNVSIVLKPIVLSLVSLVLALVAQGVFSALSPTTDTFVSGVTKSIHQLTLGKIDFRPQPKTTENDVSSSPAEAISDAAPSTTVAPPASSNNAEAHFSGYVEESTDIRLNLNSLALQTWSSSPRYILVGAGLGSAGTAMHNFAPESIGPKEIVQNQYISLLLETGILGYLVIIVAIVLFVFKPHQLKTAKNLKTAQNTKFAFRSTDPLRPVFIALLVAYALTLLFFSGLPNALHIYLFPFFF